MVHVYVDEITPVWGETHKNGWTHTWGDIIGISSVNKDLPFDWKIDVEH